MAQNSVGADMHEEASVAARVVAARHTALDRRRRFESTQHGLHGRQAVPHQRQADHRRKGRSQLSINWRLVFNKHGYIDTDTRPQLTRSITRRQNQCSTIRLSDQQLATISSWRDHGLSVCSDRFLNSLQKYA